MSERVSEWVFFVPLSLGFQRNILCVSSATTKVASMSVATARPQALAPSIAMLQEKRKQGGRRRSLCVCVCVCVCWKV